MMRDAIQRALQFDNVSRETLSKIDCFMRLLAKWNVRINLVSSIDAKDFIQRHIQDSAQLVPFMKGADNYIDMGSGGGFPGIIIAIMTGLPGTLIESDKRKAIFLREVVRQTDLNLTVHQGRVESYQTRPVSVVTARALAPLERLIGWAHPLLKKDGFCLFPKGRCANEEIHKAQKMWQCSIEKFKAKIGDGFIVRVSNIEGRRG